jgi:hypothetical protein
MPTNTLPPELNAIAKKRGVRKIVRRTDLADAFERHEFDDKTIDAFLNIQRERRPHWFKSQAELADKELKKANNPWSKDAWSVTKQGEVVKALGIEKATAIAKAAGSFVGATKPKAA